MDYFDIYKKRVSGKSNMIENTEIVLDKVFASHPFSDEVLINGLAQTVVVTQGNDSNKKNILLSHNNSIDIGSTVVIKGKTYLVTDSHGEGIYDIYPNAELELCNETVRIDLKAIEAIVGYDSKGRPIFEYIDQPPLLLPAIVEKTNVVETVNDAINIDEDRVKVTISYRDLDTIQYFKVYNELFKIASRDKTKSINGVGLLILIGERSTD